MKISFCVPIMNRFHHLKETLPHNLNVLKSLTKSNVIELNLLNFSSTDFDDSYIIDNFSEHLDSGLLRYCKLENQQYYHISGVKNLAHRSSTGDYLINLDADNFISKEYLKEVLNNSFNNTFILLKESDNHGTYGRVGTPRKLYNMLGGYDEFHEFYWYEDANFTYRAMNLVDLSDSKYKIHEVDGDIVTAINHSHSERLTNFNINEGTREVELHDLCSYLTESTDNYINNYFNGEPLKDTPVSADVRKIFDLYGDEYIKGLMEHEIINWHILCDKDMRHMNPNDSMFKFNDYLLYNPKTKEFESKNILAP
jgi:hypothetical protein